MEFGKQGSPIKYINIIKDMYKNMVTSVRTCGGLTNTFPITISIHQGSTLSPSLKTFNLTSLKIRIEVSITGIIHLDKVRWSQKVR